jgi:ribonuclease HI
VDSPPTGKIKVNWDATIDKKLGHVSFETVAWDREGHMLVARSTTISNSIDPTIAEA